MPDITIVICCHNEEGNLPTLIDRLVQHALPSQRIKEIVIVDDGSTDNSRKIVEKAQRDHQEFRLLLLPQRSGQTECFRAAFAEVSTPFVIRMDADLQDDPADLHLFFSKFDSEADLVMGLRETRQHRRILRLASTVYDIIIMLLFDSPLHSNSGSFVGFRSKLIKDIPFCGNDHRYLPLICIRRGAKKVSEVIVRHHPRTAGQSKYFPYRKIFFGIPEVLTFVFRLRLGRYDFKK